ncbi:Dihydrodipicolinate synthase protein [Salinisphaera shabanensis E1L3A]|uniref:Dihydrodipicolinate synthase protein n=1 Tax=Salinisphaera shabanensis E1L3A TaxID=1033802 RepID=U2E1N9_9GAMM|nr:dihydrodipicolinate synthase family protein [Salinisphaera shabanensis]ERJ17831.1 Dihydrodipicolinate synthase protein [Salinisphaera shabanensis E1L3A]
MNTPNHDGTHTARNASIFNGLIAFPITPLDRAGRVDTDAFGAILEPLVQSGVDAIGVLGSTGSYAYLHAAQRERVIETAVAHADGRLPVIAGIGALAQLDVNYHAQQACALGADGLLLAPVSYIPLREVEVERLFLTVADAVDRPICIYNNPGTTQFDFSAALLARLAEHPSIAALKQPAPSRDAEAAHLTLEKRFGERLQIGYSGDELALGVLAAGARSWYSVMAGVFPSAFCRLMRAIKQADYVTARSCHARMQPLWDVCRAYASYRVAHEAIALTGRAAPVMPTPLQPLATDERETVRRALVASHLL